MVDEWRAFGLGDLYEFSSGLSKPRSAFGEGFPFLTFKDVFDNVFVPQKMGDLVRSTDAERDRLSIRRGDVFLTRTSETVDELGMSCVALRDIPDATFNGFTKRLRPKHADIIVPEFAGYYFRSPRFRAEMYALSSLSTRASLNNEMLERLTILVPPREQQSAIGSILKSLDDKIDLNHRMSQTLEALARALFKSWFVDFDPARAKAQGRDPGLPKGLSDLFPDKLTEAAGVEVPDGWSSVSLDSTARFLNGLALQKYPPTGDAALPVIKIAQLRSGSVEGADLANAALPTDYVVEDGDVLFSWSGSLECAIWTAGRGALNQHLFKVTSREYPKWFYYLSIHQHLEEFRRIAAAKATTMGHIQRQHLKEAVVAAPPKVFLKAADEIMAPFIDRLIACRLESRQLASIRGALLPKLMSGDVRVPDSEREG